MPAFTAQTGESSARLEDENETQFIFTACRSSVGKPLFQDLNIGETDHLLGTGLGYHASSYCTEPLIANHSH